MKKFTKFSFGACLIVAAVLFAGCQKEMDKIEANKPSANKVLAPVPEESFGDVTLGEFHNNHLERVTQLASFPEYQFDQQYNLAVQNLPEEYAGIVGEANMGLVRETTMEIAQTANMEEYFAANIGIMPAPVAEHVTSLMGIINDCGVKMFKDPAYDVLIYLKKIRDLEKIIKADNRLSIKDVEAIIRFMTIAYYSGYYWHHVCWHPTHKYHLMPPYPVFWPYYRWVKMVYADLWGYIRGYYICGKPCAILCSIFASAMSPRYWWDWWWW